MALRQYNNTISFSRAMQAIFGIFFLYNILDRTGVVVERLYVRQHQHRYSVVYHTFHRF